MALPYPIPDPATGDWNAFALKRNLEYLDSKVPPQLTASVGIYHNQIAGGSSTSADTNETTIDTFTLPANTLSVANDALWMIARFLTANNGNTKRFRLYFGSTVVADSGAVVMTAQVGFLHAVVARATNSLQAGLGTLTWASATAGAPTATYVNSNPTETLTNPLVVTWTMQNGTASAGDCVGGKLLAMKYPGR